MAEEDKRIFNILDNIACRGHSFEKTAIVRKGRRRVEMCTRCGLRLRMPMRKGRVLPECPLAIVEHVMES